MNSASRAWRARLCVVALGAVQSLYFACRVANPGFSTDEGSGALREESSAESSETGSKDTESGATEKSTAAAEDPSTGDGGEPKDSSTGEDSGSGTPTKGDSPLPEVDEPCRKGAAFCYDFQERPEGLAPNLSGVNPENKLLVTAPADGFSTDSPVFGTRIRLIEESSVVSTQAFPFETGGAIGVDVWFASEFKSATSMMLFVLGDLLTLEIRSSGESVCKFFPKPGKSAPEVKPIPRSKRSWGHASCLIQSAVEGDATTGIIAATGLDGVAQGGFFLADLQARSAKLEIGTGASPLPADSGISPFQGDLYMVRVWNDAEAMQRHIRAELKHFDLEIAN